MASCIIVLILEAILFTIYYSILKSQPFPLSAILSFFGSLFSLFVLTTIGSSLNNLRKRLQIKAALKRETPEDGKLSAATGRIEEQGLNPCISPIIKTECLLYEYQMDLQDEQGASVRCR